MSAPPAWSAAALDGARAYGAPVGRARLKVAPEDFVVEERLGFAADGGAAHVLLRVCKRGCDTISVARALARAAGCAARDVGYAGLKDRHAVTTQWFTVPAVRAATAWTGEAGEGWQVLEALPHSRKLRRGALRGNRFRVRLRGVAADEVALAARGAVLAARGAPNYFGPQRFGRQGANVELVWSFATGADAPRGRDVRSFVYSAARALLFNAVLDRRVREGSWARILPGEFVNLAGRHSWFVAAASDAALEARLDAHDIHPTGPLAGRGESPAGACGALESEVLAAFDPLAERLAAAGLEAARRPLRVRPEDFTMRPAGEDLELEFALPAGAYATVLLRELLDTDPLPGETSDD